jgi:uncharacterized membrane protein YtjA (UPF0391 family)
VTRVRRGQPICFGSRLLPGTDEPGALFPLVMFGWAMTFLIVAVVAAFFGFGGIATFAVDIARIIFFVAIALFVLSLVGGLIGGRMS